MSQTSAPTQHIAGDYSIVIDTDGLDSMRPSTEHNNFAISMRMRMNCHRNPKAYHIKLSAEQVTYISDLLKRRGTGPILAAKYIFTIASMDIPKEFNSKYSEVDDVFIKNRATESMARAATAVASTPKPVVDNGQSSPIELF